MLDSVTLRTDIKLEHKNLPKHGWYPGQNKNINSEYVWIYNRSTKGRNFHFTYLHRAGWLPGILRIDVHSLPRLIHGTNLWYFSSSDIAEFYSLLSIQLRRVGIKQKIDFKELRLERAEIPVTLLLENQHSVERIVKAFRLQVVWSTRMVREIYVDGIYNYFQSNAPKRRKKYKAGSKFYNKKRELKNSSMFNGKGALRYEILGPNRECLKRWFGKLPTLEEFFNDRDKVEKLFEAYLRYFNIYRDCRLVSESEAEKILSKGRSKKGWNYDLQKLDAILQLGSDAVEFVSGLETREKTSDFRDKILRDRYGLLQLFLPGKTKMSYDLYSMVMKEFDKAWRQKSVFSVPVRVNEVGPRYVLPFDDVVRPQLNAVELYHGERGFSMYNNVSEKGALFHLQLGCNKVA